MPNKFKTIRTVTVTGTHTVSLYKFLIGAKRKAKTSAEWEEAAALLERFQKQTRIPIPPELEEEK